MQKIENMNYGLRVRVTNSISFTSHFSNILFIVTTQPSPVFGVIVSTTQWRDFKYLSLYEKYHAQWKVYKSLAWGYLKIGDNDRAKEYRKRALFSRPYDPRLIAGYVLSSWGKAGEFLLTAVVRAWHEIKYAVAKNKRWNRKMDPHMKRNNPR